MSLKCQTYQIKCQRNGAVYESSKKGEKEVLLEKKKLTWPPLSPPDIGLIIEATSQWMIRRRVCELLGKVAGANEW